MNPDEVMPRLRAAIPDFACEPGCHDCCGPIFFSRWEWARVTDRRETMGLDCPWASEKGCAIHAERPLTCRWFGAVAEWPCPRGRGPRQPIPWDQARKMIDEYHALMREEDGA